MHRANETPSAHRVKRSHESASSLPSFAFPRVSRPSPSFRAPRHRFAPLAIIGVLHTSPTPRGCRGSTTNLSNGLAEHLKVKRQYASYRLNLSITNSVAQASVATANETPPMIKASEMGFSEFRIVE